MAYYGHCQCRTTITSIIKYLFGHTFDFSSILYSGRTAANWRRKKQMLTKWFEWNGWTNDSSCVRYSSFWLACFSHSVFKFNRMRRVKVWITFHRIVDSNFAGSKEGLWMFFTAIFSLFFAQISKSSSGFKVFRTYLFINSGNSSGLTLNRTFLYRV